MFDFVHLPLNDKDTAIAVGSLDHKQKLFVELECVTWTLVRHVQKFVRVSGKLKLSN